MKTCPKGANVEIPAAASGRLKAIAYSKSIRKPTRRAGFGEKQKLKEERRVRIELEKLDSEHREHRERMKAVAEELRKRER